MPARKLTYEVDVNTRNAVSDLRDLGDAGARAGKDIADGFDQAESASTSALKALSTQLDQVESDAKGTAEAVAAIKANLTVDVDDAKVNQFVGDLEGKMGVAFDDITADAEEFAAVLERGVDLSKTTSEIRGVGGELEHTRGEADQSRSVLANMAGNSAQSLGALGGVVGDLGVGLGQLAEYATEGNISMSGLASIAGPMAALSAATLLVGQYTQNIAETKAWERDQVDGYTDAINDAGDSIQAVLQMAEDGLTGRIRDDSILGGVLDKEKTIDLIKVLDSFGLTLTDVQAAIRSGATDRTSFVAWMHSGSVEADAFIAKFPNLASSGTQYTEVLEGLAVQAAVYTEAAEGVAQKNRVMASSIDSVNESLGLLRIDDDPLSVLSDSAIQLGQVSVDTQWAWRQLVMDLADGKADTEASALAVDAFAEAMHMSKEEVEALAMAQSDGVKSASDFQAMTDVATKTSDANAEAVRGQVDALQALIDKQNDMLSATDDLADAQQAWDDGLAAFPQTIADSQGAMAAATNNTEYLAAVNDQRDAVEGLVEQYVTATDLQAKANGQQLTATQRVDAQATALGILAGNIDHDVIPALADYYSSVFKIPKERKTDFEMVLASGDQAAIEQFVADNSGTWTLAIDVDANATQLRIVGAAIDTVAAARTAPVTAVAHTGNAKADLLALVGPKTVPIDADTNPADTTLSDWRGRQGRTPVTVPLHVQVSTSGGTAGFHYGASPYAVEGPTATAAAAAPAATGGDGRPMIHVSTPPPVVVNLSAGLIGNRYDLARWVRAATRDQQRLGRMPTVTAS